MDPAGQKYLDSRVRRYTREAQRSAIKMGVFVASFSWVVVGLAYWVGFTVLDLAVMAAIGSFVTVFAMWSLGLTSVQNTFEFVQAVNREYEEAKFLQ